MDISWRIKEIINQSGLNQEAIGKIAGFSQSYISAVANGKKIPLDNLEKICLALNISLAEFFRPFGDINPVPSHLQAFYDHCSTLTEEDINAFLPIINHLKQLHSNMNMNNKNITYRTHVLGEAAAGLPLYAPADDDDIIELPAKYADPALQCYAIRARGDSMEPKIHSGDIIIVQHDVAPDPGQMAVVHLASLSDDEYAIKVVTFDNGKCILRSYNPKYPPMIYSADDIRACEKVLEIIPQS